MRMTSKQKTLRLVQLSLLVALVVVLQLLSALIPPIAGTVSITLTLVPVVVGAILFGISGGFVLGFTFGLIVLINCITGLDPGGNVLWTVNPVMTALLCFVKGIAAGVVPAVLYKLIKENKESKQPKDGRKQVVTKNCDVTSGEQDLQKNGRKFVSALVAALSAPIVNTGLFVCGMLVFFMDTLTAWAGGTSVASFVLLGLAGVNFIVEFLINIILTPAIVRIVDVVRKKLK